MGIFKFFALTNIILFLNILYFKCMILLLFMRNKNVLFTKKIKV